MSFAQTVFLLGSIAVVAPVLAHLLARPRYRRLPFTLLHFLRFGQQEVQARRKLRNLLLLLLRCAIIVLIAMLFARPRLLAQAKTETVRTVHFLGLDNSLSMAYADGGKSYFQQMLSSAADYIRSASPEGVFHIFALASGDRRNNLSKAQALAYVKQIPIVPSVADPASFAAAVQAAKERGPSDDTVRALMISDFTPKMIEQLSHLTEAVPVEGISYELIRFEQAIRNTALIDAHVDGLVGGKLRIGATVVNYAPQGESRTLTARVGEEQMAAIEVNLTAGQRESYPLSIPVDADGGDQSCFPIELSLSQGDGLREDDTFYVAATLPKERTTNVLLIGSDTRELFLLKTALESLSLMDAYETISVKEIAFADSYRDALGWADVAVCAGLPDELVRWADRVDSFVQKGGRAIFFLTANSSPDVLKELWRADVLPAWPRRHFPMPAHIAPPTVYADALSPDGETVRALCNYEIETIVLFGFFECEESLAGRCLLRLQNGSGFVYFKHHGNGSVVLVNTSADDSLGTLTRSPAAVAFCRYLLGPPRRPIQYSFASDETIALPVSEFESEGAGKKHEVWIMTPSGEARAAPLSGSFLSVQCPHEIGWLRTLTKPVGYAGVNVPEGETDMREPADEAVADLMGRVFRSREEEATEDLDYLSDREYRPIERVFAWLIIGLILFESFVANRIKR